MGSLSSVSGGWQGRLAGRAMHSVIGGQGGVRGGPFAGEGGSSDTCF